MAGVEIRLVGIEQIDAVVKGLPLEINHKLLQEANAKAAQPLVEKQHLFSPVGNTGNLAESMGIVKGPKAFEALGLIDVGPRVGGQYKGNVAHLVERGTKRRQTKSGANRGVMPALHFLERAFEQTKTVVQENINVELARKVYAFMKRTIRNA